MFGKKRWLAIVRDEQWTIAKVSSRKKNITILRFSQMEPGAGDETSGSALPLKDWLRKQRVSIKKLQIAYACPGVITRMIVLPKMGEKDLDKLLTEYVDQYFTLNVEDYLIDYRVVQYFAEEGQEKQRVLLAALPKYQWKKFLATCDSAGFQPKVVDLAADSVVRLYNKLGGNNVIPSENNPDRRFDCAIVDLGRDRVEFVLLEEGIFFLYSDMEISLGTVAETLNNTRLIMSQNLLEPDEVGIITPSESDLSVELENALMPVLSTLGEFINFFAAKHFGKAIDNIFITGELSDLPFLEELFSDNLGVETKIGFPKGWRPSFTRRLRTKANGWMKYASLYGLAFRED